MFSNASFYIDVLDMYTLYTLSYATLDSYISLFGSTILHVTNRTSSKYIHFYAFYDVFT